MKTVDQNRVNMLTAVSGVIEKNKNTWKAHEAFSEGVDALTEKLSSIDEQAQIAQGNSGASDVKEQARQDLCTSACEIIGGVRAYAKVNADPALAAKVDYAPSDVTVGKSSDVVARCKTIYTAANEIVDELGKYGITAAKLATLKKRIDAFDGVKTAPRQSRVEKSAAAQLLPQLVRSGVDIVRDQLDGLVVQFKMENPNFYEGYFAARVVVDNRGGQANNGNGSVTPPKPNTEPVPVPAHT